MVENLNIMLEKLIKSARAKALVDVYIPESLKKIIKIVISDDGQSGKIELINKEEK